MKTKIIYISGNEIFDMNDIRAAFEEVRNALNLDKNTVLFGVPVDNEDAGLSTKTDNIAVSESNITDVINTPEPESIETSEIIEPEPEFIPEPIEMVEQTESVVETPIKKRGRPRKETTITETVVDSENQDNIDTEKIVPILSVLSTNEDENGSEPQNNEIVENIDIISEISDEPSETIESKEDDEMDIQISDDDADLEKLLSEMTPLDVSEDTNNNEPIIPVDNNDDNDISVDATLEQLATEFAEKQDKITSETKSTSRNRIGKLRNILPFKQSKHKDTGLGDLFGWAGIAANDEDFSVPGFFTNAASRK